jgi:hypothetical protein
MRQFNWSRHWTTRVKPHLDDPRVKVTITMGMRLYDKNWQEEDGPHSIGRGSLNGQRVRRGALSWYQPWGRCHWIAFFACVIGALNYPHLDWRIYAGRTHTIAVGEDHGQPAIVMDILHFTFMTAEESVALTSDKEPNGDGGWELVFQYFEESLRHMNGHITTSEYEARIRALLTAYRPHDESMWQVTRMLQNMQHSDTDTRVGEDLTILQQA